MFKFLSLVLLLIASSLALSLALSLSVTQAEASDQCTIVPFEKYFPTTFYTGVSTRFNNRLQVVHPLWSPVYIKSFRCTYNGTVFCQPKPSLSEKYRLTNLYIACHKVETGPLRRFYTSGLKSDDLVELGSCTLNYRLQETVGFGATYYDVPWDGASVPSSKISQEALILSIWAAVATLLIPALILCKLCRPGKPPMGRWCEGCPQCDENPSSSSCVSSSCEEGEGEDGVNSNLPSTCPSSPRDPNENETSSPTSSISSINAACVASAPEPVDEEDNRSTASGYSTDNNRRNGAWQYLG